MKERFTAAVLGTSAPHFPLDLAEKNYLNCLEALRHNFNFNFLSIERIVTDTVSFESELRELKAGHPDFLILIQAAFTWDNIAVWLQQFFAGMSVLLWAVPEEDYSEGILKTNSLSGAIMNNSAFHKLGVRNSFIYGLPQDADVIERLGNVFNAVCVKS